MLNNVFFWGYFILGKVPKVPAACSKKPHFKKQRQNLDLYSSDSINYIGPNKWLYNNYIVDL